MMNQITPVAVLLASIATLSSAVNVTIPAYTSPCPTGTVVSAAPAQLTPSASCQAQYDACRGSGDPNFAVCAAQSASCFGSIATSTVNAVVLTTEVVTALTTFCPEATQITHGTKTYTVTSATTLTITDCPCTITRPVSQAPAVPTVVVPEHANATNAVVITTQTVASIVTYCPSATTLTVNSQTHTVTGPTTLTLTNGPYTVTNTITAAPQVQTSAVIANATVVSTPVVLTTTQVVNTLTTYCPTATTLTINSETHTITTPTTLTLTNGPYTVINTIPVVVAPTGVPAVVPVHTGAQTGPAGPAAPQSTVAAGNKPSGPSAPSYTIATGAASTVAGGFQAVVVAVAALILA